LNLLFNMNLNRKKKSDELLKGIKEFCEDTSFHGLLNIVKTGSWLFRFIWIFLLVIAVLYCSLCNRKL
jgi:hypothetical protein